MGLPPLPLLPPIPLLLLLLQLQQGDPDHIYDKFIKPFCLLFFMGENIHLWDGYVSKNLGHQAESRLILRFAIFFQQKLWVFRNFPHIQTFRVEKRGNGNGGKTWVSQALFFLNFHSPGGDFERAMNLRLEGFTPLQHGKAEELISKRKDIFPMIWAMCMYIYIYSFFAGGMESRSYWNGIYRMKKFGEIKIFARIRWQVVPSAWFHHSSLKNCPSVFFCESEKMMIADCPTNQIWFFSAGLSTKHLGRKYLTSKPWCMELSIPPVPRHVWKLHTETVDLLERCIRKLELFRSVPVVPALMKGLMFGVLVLTICYHFQASESQWHQGIAGIPKNHQMPTYVSYFHLACYTQEATWHLP